VIFETLVMTLSAQIMVLPILILYFNSLSVVSPIVNLIIVPIIPFLMLLGFLQVVLAFIWIKLGIFFGYFTWFFSHLVLEIIKWFASLGFSQIKVENARWFILIPFYIVILINIIVFNYKKKNEKQRN
jgi:competence protein ComEC